MFSSIRCGSIRLQVFWEFCEPIVKDNQLFVRAAKSQKLPENFSFVDGYELRLAGCAKPELEEAEALALLVCLGDAGGSWKCAVQI